MKKFGLVARTDAEAVLSTVRDIVRYGTEKGFEVVLEERVASKLGEKGKKLGEMDIDCLIIVGGDGTVLRALLESEVRVPVLPLRYGRRGFLSELSYREWREAFESLEKGSYFVEEAMRLSATSREMKLPDALNEILITARKRGKLVSFRVSQDDVPLAEFDADGLIVATPTGSTAHSFSAGGPVVGVDFEAIVITPICPLQKAHSIVVPGDSHVQVRTEPEEVGVVVDGNFVADVTSPIDIEKSTKSVKFVRFDRSYYGERIRKSFGTS